MHLLSANISYFTALFYIFLLIISDIQPQPLLATAKLDAGSRLPDPYCYVFIAKTQTPCMQSQKGTEVLVFWLPKAEGKRMTKNTSEIFSRRDVFSGSGVWDEGMLSITSFSHLMII